MPDEAGWYEVVEGGELTQGDLLSACPVSRVLGFEQWPVPTGQPVEVEIYLEDLVILSQSCDLANDKIQDVILAQVLNWQVACAELVKQGNLFARSKQFRRALIAGNIPSLSLLHQRDEPPALGWSVVDFHRVFVLSKPVVVAVARAAGPRLRLRPPYREYLAQAFARYFMRVGLPLDAKAFETAGEG
jgi:hypothetical protein